MPLFSGQQSASNGFRNAGAALPKYNSAVQEKMHRGGRSQSWTVPLSIPIPGVNHRRLRIPAPNVARMHAAATTRFGRRRGLLVLLVAAVCIGTVFVKLTRKIGKATTENWPIDIGMRDPPTLVYEREDLQKIWLWEISSGHYPSNREIPHLINFTTRPLNPALPAKNAPIVLQPKIPSETGIRTAGHGPKRVYLDIQAKPPNVAYPPRPVPGSVADLDVVMDHCDFSQQKYVRDCLEVLRLGAGLDNGNRVRRGKMNEWKYIYSEVGDVQDVTAVAAAGLQNNIDAATGIVSSDPNYGLPKKPRVDYEPHLTLPAPRIHTPAHALPSTCDPENPRVFHMFWAGPFTDKPYLALLSFLFTQNLRLHIHEDAPDASVCRPQFWMWINPGPAASVPNPSAVHDLFEGLKVSPWASPFLHPRFKDVIKFRLWNTTEQLDGIPELKDEWRSLPLFNSGGHVVHVPVPEKAPESSESESTEKKEDDMLNRLGSTSASTYDRLSVTLSDMARFVLCHRFGGVYLDADTIFLRDWEELWGWKGAFAYRWSRMEKYNTAVLRMNRNSALGTFLFRTALKNGLDFHPMSVSKYTKDAAIEGLLLRLPDALFDSAWLNTEDFQRNRPPQPYLLEFADFFNTPSQVSSQPQALGFEGFFRGAYSYHFHNFWWEPFDRSRNWPDLGPKFLEGERRARLGAEAMNSTTELPEDFVKEDKRDLDWATVLKRTFESYIRGERPNMYGEWLEW